MSTSYKFLCITIPAKTRAFYNYLLVAFIIFFYLLALSRKLFIGGLSWETTDGTVSIISTQHDSYLYCRRSERLLLQVWQGTTTLPTLSSLQSTQVDACTIMRDASGTSKGFAFLTFEDPASVNAVVVCEHFLDGKAVGQIFCPLTSLNTSRLTRSVQSRGRNIFEPPATLLADFLRIQLLILCASFFLHTARW